LQVSGAVKSKSVRKQVFFERMVSSHAMVDTRRRDTRSALFAVSKYNQASASPISYDRPASYDDRQGTVEGWPFKFG
jgi:hypothetical protein